jgi:hypothetical protein
MPEVVLRDKSGRPVLSVADDGFTLLAGDGSLGLPPGVAGQGRFAGVVAAAQTVFAFQVPGIDTSYELEANLNITTLGSGNINVQVVYTDETGAVRTAFQVFQLVNGSTQTALATAAAFMGYVTRIRAKAGTTVTMSTTGTFTGCTYNVEGRATRV